MHPSEAPGALGELRRPRSSCPSGRPADAAPGPRRPQPEPRAAGARRRQPAREQPAAPPRPRTAASPPAHLLRAESAPSSRPRSPCSPCPSPCPHLGPPSLSSPLRPQPSPAPGAGWCPRRPASSPAHSPGPSAAPGATPGCRMVPEVRVLASLLGLALLGLPLDSHARARPDMFCLFHGKKYAPGESWHPYLEPQGLMYCLRCTCSESAHVSCYRLHCPPVHCPQPVTEPQQCCPRCMEPHTPSGLRAPPKSCQYNGTMYQHGEIFSTQELFPSRLPNQCVLCSCTEGQVYCGLMTCPEPGCPAPLPLPASCCQACRDGSGEKSGEEDPTQTYHGVRHPQDPCARGGGGRRGPGTPAPTGLSSPMNFIPHHFRPKGAGSTTVKIVLKEKHKKACVHSGKTYSHGEVWHPAFRSFGPLPCILCTCQDGRQDCQRVICPTEYPCQQPEKAAGKCCKICPEDKAEPGHREVSATRCPKVPGQVLVHASVSPAPNNLRRFALEHESSEQVDIYLWKLVKGIFHLIQIKKVRKQDFQKEAQNFRLLSGTHEGILWVSGPESSPLGGPGYWKVFLAQTPELKVTASPDKATKTL
ncbi:chordin-like protein 2 isoform X3 [Erinaceus europaeus]|uniref:Chordin-like protein 2 isoform X3 n=1 Tax=Erinaceus europaeus TaxID=9365 RepID=A0ABM3W8B4_ERIEU|nr:chordin-like protein 2 isoform X3 [Erinaceus europaeus]